MGTFEGVFVIGARLKRYTGTISGNWNHFGVLSTSQIRAFGA